MASFTADASISRGAGQILPARSIAGCLLGAYRRLRFAARRPAALAPV